MMKEKEENNRVLLNDNIKYFKDKNIKLEQDL